MVMFRQGTIDVEELWYMTQLNGWLWLKNKYG